MLNLSPELISSLRPETKQELSQLLTEAQYRWSLNARPSQLIPDGDWTVWLIKTGRGWGKMIDINTDIKTTTGWKKLADIRDGDEVFNNNGFPVTVLKAHDIIETDAYELTFDTGEKIKACKDHLWYTISKLEDKQIRRGKLNHGSVKTTQEIVNTLKYGGRETNHRIPIATALNYSEKMLSIDPYVLGVWLGDGASACGEITCADKEITDRISGKGYNVKHRNDLQYTINAKPSERNKINGQFKSNGSLHSELKNLNLLHNKHIPSIYLNSGINQRMELLKGLMDTDGYCEINGWCEFVTIKEQLSKDVYELISSLGIKTRIYECPSFYYGRYKGQKYRIFFRTKQDVFALQRKRNRQLNATKKQMSRHENRFIVKADKTGKIKMRCLTVDSQDGLFLITKSFIATHNTRTGAETVRIWKETMPIIHFFGATSGDARDIMIEGPAGILSVSPPWDKPKYSSSLRKVTWNNGSYALIFTADEPERARGPQCYAAWCDELASWRYAEDTWDNMMMGLRMGDHPRVLVTTTPRPTKLIKELVKAEYTHVTSGTTYENIDNLPDAFFKTILTKYEGTRLGRQELMAEILEDVEGALWKMNIIENNRVKTYPDLVRVAVAIDPAVTSTKESDETGIIAGGMAADGQIYILEDASGIFTPQTWAAKAIGLYDRLKADRIIGEANNGGDLIETVLRSIDRNISYQKVTASRGKIRRAEPVEALYEQGRVHHVGIFPKLEDQMTTYTGDTKDDSPDHMDALVWLCTYLVEKDIFNADDEGVV